jgi:hypothetical protein
MSNFSCPPGTIAENLKLDAGGGGGVLLIIVLFAMAKEDVQW